MLELNLQLFGVDWIPCNKCGETFPDCGDFVYCDCGIYWCCDECAEEEGYEIKNCEKWDHNKDSDENYDKVCKKCEKRVDCNCEGEVKSCKYCRKEDFEDTTLFEFLLSKENKSREDIVNEYKEYISKK